MANIFPPNTNRRFYGGVALIALAVALALGGVYYVNFQIPEYEPVQPVRFSHKLHAGDLKMSCTACHSAAQRSPRAGIPDTKSCLGCHQHILPDSPLIEGEGSGDVVEDAEVVDDQAVGLVRRVHAVGASDRLE